MPIGPPFHVPEPKSALSPADVPMLEIQAADCAWTGSPDTSACQKELTGVMGQDGAPGTGLPSATAAGIRATRTSRMLAIRGVRTIVRECVDRVPPASPKRGKPIGAIGPRRAHRLAGEWPRLVLLL